MDRQAPDRAHRNTGLRNRQAVLREILLSGPLSRIETAGRVGLTPTSLSRIVRGLIGDGLVRELPPQPRARPGRRQVPLEIDPQGGQVLGIGIGPTFQTVTLADLGNGVVEGTHLECATIEDPDHVVEHVASEGRRLIGARAGDRAHLLGCLAMVTASVDPASGGIVAAPYLGWGSYPLQARLAASLGLPVQVRSMAATVARAEALFGAARGRSSVLTLLCGLGTGAALILDGRLIEGQRFRAGGIGWLKTAAEDGTPATLDDLASGLGILRRLHGEGMEPGGVPLSVMARALLQAIERDGAGDPAASALMSSAGGELGRAVIGFTLLSPPDLVLIAGPLSLSQRYVAAAREAIAEGTATSGTEVLASGVTGPVGGLSASCAMTIYEFLIEARPGPAAPRGDRGTGRP